MAFSSIGQKTIEINWENFASGMTTANSSQDGGFALGTSLSGTLVSIVNPISQPGVMRWPAAPTDKSTGLTGEMVASCEDPALSSQVTRLFVSTDAQQDGRFFTINSAGTLTEVGAEDALGNYIYGRTDIIGFQGEAYVTNSVNIVRWERPANTFTYNFFGFSDTFAPHPAIVFEDNAFYGDGNLLLRQTAAGAAPTTILTLPANQVIVALGIDPGSGKMLISTVGQYNVSGSVNSEARVLYYDGFSNKVLKVVIVDSMVTAFYNVGSMVFVFYGQRMGYWNGAGIQFVRKLNVALANDELVYKHHITNIGDILFFIEKYRILAYGEVIFGKGRSFWYALQNAPSGTGLNLTLLANIGMGLLSYSYATAKFYTFDTTSVATPDPGLSASTAALFTIEYQFERAVNFNQVVFEYESNLPTNTELGVVTLFYRNTNELISTMNVGAQSTNYVECPWPVEDTRTLQVRLIARVATGLKRMTIFYSERG